MNKKRILIFSPGYLPGIGGAEIAMKEITDRLPEFEFEMITAKMDISNVKEEKIGNILVHRIGFQQVFVDKLFLILFGARVGYRLHQQKPFDAVWSLMASYGAFAALSFKEKTKVPFLLTLQEGDPLDQSQNKVGLFHSRFKKIFSSADAIQPISQYLCDWAMRMGYTGSHREVIPNGVEIERFTQPVSSEKLKTIRESFDLPDDAIRIVTTSRLVKKNGVEDVIRALPLLDKRACFVICGVGELEDHLKSLVTELNLESRVRFLGNKTHAEIPEILHSCDIFIRPSLSEGLGNSFLEAMAAGLPTIGTPVGGIPDFLVEGKTGFLCEPKNPQSIAEAIVRAMNLSVIEKEKLHQQAMKVIEEKYNWKYVVERMRKLFEKIL